MAPAGGLGVQGGPPLARHQAVEEGDNAIALVHLEVGQEAWRHLGVDLAEVAQRVPHRAGAACHGNFLSKRCHIVSPCWQRTMVIDAVSVWRCSDMVACVKVLKTSAKNKCQKQVEGTMKRRSLVKAALAGASTLAAPAYLPSHSTL